MKYLFLIVGEIRCLTTFNKLLNVLKNEDIIHCGYSKDIQHFKFKKNNIKHEVISNISEISKLLPKNTSYHYFQRNMIQWFHLHNCIINNYNAMSEYDFIIKIRTDTILNNNVNLFKQKISTIKNNALYTLNTKWNKDSVFVSRSSCFLEKFKHFYPNIKSSKKKNTNGPVKKITLYLLKINLKNYIILNHYI